MAGTTSDSGVGKSLEETSSGEALSEWRSSEQMENVIASTSAPYWDTDDEEDPGQNPSDMYGHHTWKIDNFSQINKRELRSSAFEVGSYKWYILIYPQGCDVCNHLSVFLCVANHDKLHPGWSHFAQFTIAVVNKDPKKSKYSDTLHRFRKKEHDWGWKKFMELSKVLEGFVTDDQLTIKAQVQVIREKPDRPFRCLDSYYRKVLLGVYLSNVEQICLRFVDEKLNKLTQLREDKARWSGFRAFWIAIDQNTRQEMCREKADTILRAIVKQFFIDKEVTSTLVMDSLYSGLRALEDHSKGKIGNKDILVAGEQIVPIMHMEDGMFVLVDDVLNLFGKPSMEPLPPMGSKGSQSRMKEDGWLEDCSKEFNELNERRLTEIGRRSIEIFVLAHIFGKIEVAYQEDVSFKRQEELIREEAVWLAQTEQRSKRGVSEKGKKLKKKQAKQKRNYRKGKDKGKTEKSSAVIGDDPQPDISSDDEEEQILDVAECLLNNFKPEKFVVVSDLASCLPELPSPGSEEREASYDASSSCLSGHSGVQRETWEKNKLYLVDDSSSTCSTDSVPSIVTNILYGGFSLPKPRNRKSVNRIKNQRGSATVNGKFGYHGEAYNRQPEGTSESSKLIGAGGSGKVESQSKVASLSLNSKKFNDHHMTKKEKVVSLERESSIKGQAIEEKAFKEKIKLLPSKIMSCTVPVKPESKTSVPANLIVIDKPSSERATSVINTVDTTNAVKKEPHKIVPNIPTNKPLAHPLPVVSRPLSAPIIPGPKTFAPIVSHVQTPPVLSRSVSAASYVPISYRNAIMGIAESHSQSSSPNPSQTHTQLSNYPSSSCDPSQSHRLVSLSPNSEFNPSQARKSVPHSPSSQTQVYLSPSSAFNPSQSHTQVSLSPNSQPYQPQSQTRVSPSQSSSFNPSQWHTQVCPSPCLTQYPSQSHTQISYSPISSLDSSNLHTQTSNSISASVSSPLSTERINPVSLVNKNEKVNIPDLVNTSLTSGLGDDFPHLDIINNLLDDEFYIESLHSMTRRDSQPLSFPIDITGIAPEFVANSISSSRFEQDYNDNGYQLGYGSLVSNFDDMIPQINSGLYTNEPIDGLIPSQSPTNGGDMSYWTNWEIDNYPYNFLQNANLAYSVIDYTAFEPSNAH